MPNVISIQQLDCQPLQAVVLLLGSNHNACDGLATARHQLQSLGTLTKLGACYAPDYSGKSQAWYHNEAWQIALIKPCSWAEVVAVAKAIEQACGRRDGELVAMDIDVLMVRPCGGEWRLMAERCPLKSHERQCLTSFLGQ